MAGRHLPPTVPELRPLRGDPSVRGSPGGARMTAPRIEDFVYVDTAFGGVNKRNDVKRLGDVRLNGVSDCYVSHGRADEALPAWIRTHTNEHGRPTVAGFDGATWADNLH